MNKLQKLIEKRLDKTRDCDYKKTHIPKGWAHIPIKRFSRELTEEIYKTFKNLIIRR